MLKAVGEFFDSLFHILWELIKFFTLVFFFAIMAIGTFFKWILKALYYIFIYPPLWVLRKTYRFFQNAAYGARARKRKKEIETFGEDV